MSAVNFLYLSEPDMIKAGVLDSQACVETIEEVFRLLAKGDYIMGGPKENSHGVMLWFPKEPRFNIPVAGPDRRFMAMIGYLGGDFNVCGEKWYGSNVENPSLRKLPRSILMIMLNDPVSSEPLALMSGNLVSAMRTGAVPGVGAKYLAREGACSAGILGAGVISKASLLSICAGCPSIKTAWVYDLFEEKSNSFAQEMSKATGIEVKTAHSVEECVSSSDIISVATSGKNPVKIEDAWLRDGALLEISGVVDVSNDFILNSRIVVDNWKMHHEWWEEGLASAEGLDGLATWAGSGQVIKLLEAGKLDENTIANLGDVVLSGKTVRRDENEKVFFIAGGMPVHDIAWSYKVYQKAKAMGLGQTLNLWEEPHWF